MRILPITISNTHAQNTQQNKSLAFKMMRSDGTIINPYSPEVAKLVGEISDTLGELYKISKRHINEMIADPSSESEKLLTQNVVNKLRLARKLSGGGVFDGIVLPDETVANKK